MVEVNERTNEAHVAGWHGSFDGEGTLPIVCDFEWRCPLLDDPTVEHDGVSMGDDNG